MADEQYTFAQARTRLEEIVTQVRKKDVSLEKSLDLLEEGVRLANICTELSDHTEWRTVIDEQEDTSGDPAGVSAPLDGAATAGHGPDGDHPGDGADGSPDHGAAPDPLPGDDGSVPEA